MLLGLFVRSIREAAGQEGAELKRCWLTADGAGLITGWVPVMVAVSPRDVAGEWCEHVEKAPSNDHVVVGTGEQRHSEHTPADTCVTKYQCHFRRQYQNENLNKNDSI